MVACRDYYDDKDELEQRSSSRPWSRVSAAMENLELCHDLCHCVADGSNRT